MKIKFLITGASGMLGKSLISQLKKKKLYFFSAKLKRA